MNLTIAISGNLRDYMDAKLAIAEGGMMKAAGLASRVAVMRLREDVMAAGLRRGNANAWRSNVYPATDRSLRPAVYIFSKAPKIIQAFNADTTITPKGKKYLAIPIGKIARVGRGGNTKRQRPEQVLENFGGVIEWKPLKGDRGFLVVGWKQRYRNTYGESTQLPGMKTVTGRRALKINRNKKGTPLYLMLKIVRLQKRLNVDRIARELGEEWPEIVAKSLAEALRNDDAPAVTA